MGRRYIYNKKRRVRKVPNNTVVLELENERNLSPSLLLNETYKAKKLKDHQHTINLDSAMTLLPPSSNKIQPDIYGELKKNLSTYDNRLLVNLEQPMIMNVKRKSVILECTNDKADKKLCKNETSESIDTEIQPKVLNKKVVNKMKIEPLKKTSSFTQPRTLQQTVATSNLASNNNPTFILVSKTSIDDIGKEPINLTSNANLKEISFKTLGTRLLNSQTKNVIQRRPILPRSVSESNSNAIEYLKASVNESSDNVQHESILCRLTSASSSNPIVFMKKSNNKPSSYGFLDTPDEKLQASGNFQHESILHKFTSASTSNPIICMRKSDISFYGTTLLQNNESVNTIQENASYKNVLNISSEDTKHVYPVALKVNNFKDSDTLEIFSNDLLNEEEMQILGI